MLEMLEIKIGSRSEGDLSTRLEAPSDPKAPSVSKAC